MIILPGTLHVNIRVAFVRFFLPLVVAFTGRDGTGLALLEAQYRIGHGHPSNRNVWADRGASARQVDSGDGGDGYFGMPPRRCHPDGRTPRKRMVQGRVFPRATARKAPPLRPKKSPIFPAAFPGCNTLHLASKAVCQTFPLDSLFAGLRPA